MDLCRSPVYQTNDPVIVIWTSQLDNSNEALNRPFGTGEEVRNRLSRWQRWRPSWILDRTYFSYFWSTSHLDTSYQVSGRLTFPLKSSILKLIFKMEAILDHRLERFSYFWSTTLSRYFLLSFKSNGFSDQEKKYKTDFQYGG